MFLGMRGCAESEFESLESRNTQDFSPIITRLFRGENGEQDMTFNKVRLDEIKAEGAYDHHGYRLV
jgi:hypothetical protein